MTDSRVPITGLTSLVLSNPHVPLLGELAGHLLATYRVRARFEYEGIHGDSLWVNGRKLLWRPSKRGDFSREPGVRLLDHNLSRQGGGSNKYPRLGEKGSYCVLEFTSYGMPCVELRTGWDIHVLSLEKITTELPEPNGSEIQPSWYDH